MERQGREHVAGLNGDEMQDDVLLFFGHHSLGFLPLLRRVVLPLENFKAGADELRAVELARRLHRYSGGLVPQLEKDEGLEREGELGVASSPGDTMAFYTFLTVAFISPEKMRKKVKNVTFSVT